MYHIGETHWEFSIVLWILSHFKQFDRIALNKLFIHLIVRFHADTYITMTSLMLQGGPQAGRDSKIGNQVGDFDPLNDSMNSNQDGVLAQAFARNDDDLDRQPFEDVPREPSVSGRPADKSMADGAEQTADPADANDSDGQDASNTAVEKYSDSLHNLQDLSNAAEFADQEKDQHGATSTHVQQQVGPF
jgi:hypothetical protein